MRVCGFPFRTAMLVNRQRRLLSLEFLEGRCLPSTVTNLNDAGPGSLRDAIINTPAGGTVDFQPGLTGTITLSDHSLAVIKNVTIVGPGADQITVQATGPRVLYSDFGPGYSYGSNLLYVAQGAQADSDRHSGQAAAVPFALTDDVLFGKVVLPLTLFSGRNLFTVALTAVGKNEEVARFSRLPAHSFRPLL